jgi:Lipase (class 3)
MDKKRQVIAVLSTLSNINMGLVTKTEQELVESIQLELPKALKDETITDFIGNWELVWGPYISATQNSKYALKYPNQWVTDNAMYVVKGVVPDTDSPLYVVAIAGTNPISTKGWRDEDFKVYPMKKWDESDAHKGNISEGSNNGLDILLKPTDNNGHNIIDFFNGLETPPEEIATCGHSLGGALAPLVALKLIEAKAAPKVSTYPSAGATSGDYAFAQYAGKMLVDNYFSTINNYDVVPHAWACKKSNEDNTWFTLDNLQELYDTVEFNNGKKITMPDTIKKIVNDHIDTLTKGNNNYTRILPEKELAFSVGAWDRTGETLKQKLLAPYVTEAGWQHTTAYNLSAGFDLPDNLVKQIETYLHHEKE